MELRMRKCTSISKNQSGLMRNIYNDNKSDEWYRVRKKDLHIVFINLEKGYDNNQENTLASLKSIPKIYINIVQDMY